MRLMHGRVEKEFTLAWREALANLPFNRVQQLRRSIASADDRHTADAIERLFRAVPGKAAAGEWPQQFFKAMRSMESSNLAKMRAWCLSVSREQFAAAQPSEHTKPPGPGKGKLRDVQ